jgi:ATP-dependent DNA helicase RecQ
MARTGQRFGTEHLVSILLGEDNDRVLQFGHEKLPTFGVGADRSRHEWRSIIRQLYAAGHISQDISAYGSWALTQSGQGILKGGGTFQMRKDVLQPKGKSRSKSSAAAAVDIELGDADQELLVNLKGLRRDMAAARNVPAYVIFPDRTLMELASARPQSLNEMSSVHGVGAVKLEKYGGAFIEAIRNFAGGA